MSEFRIVGSLLGVAGAGMLVLGLVMDSSFLAAVASLIFLFAGYLLGRDWHAGPAYKPIDFDDVNEKIRLRAEFADIVRENLKDK